MAKKKVGFESGFAKEGCKRLLATASYEHHIDTLFRDMIEVFCIVVRNAVEPCDEEWHKREARYFEHLATYGKDAFNTMTEIMSELRLEARRRHGDLLGELYMTLGTGRSSLGQFFTPFSVSKMMATMTMDLGMVEDKIATKGYVAVHEPTCGSGGMIIAVASALRDLGKDPARHLLVTAQDIDVNCQRMSYLSTWLYNIPAWLILGDTLKFEQRDVIASPALYAAISRGEMQQAA